MREQIGEQIGRIAFRREGPNWNCYYALGGTMEGSICLGSIRMSLVEHHSDIKDKFMELMREALAIIIKEETGGSVSWGAPHNALDHERGGNA